MILGFEKDSLNLIVPELAELLVKRYQLLRKIYYSAPIGRRPLASYFQLGEKILRREVDLLREQGLLIVEQRGISLTPSGENLVTAITPYLKSLLGLTSLEEKLLKILKVKRVIVIPGNIENDEVVLLEMGRAAAKILRELLEPEMILAVSGGTSCAAVADMLSEGPAPPGIEVVPARGGLGEVVDYQANNIAARVAQKLNARYRLLHLPDSLGEEALQIVMKDEKIKMILGMINSAKVLLHGIGIADEMARCRNATPEEIRKLVNEGAVGEVFGLFFNAEGEIIGSIPGLGLYLDNLNKHASHVIVVAGGRRKAEAIIAIVGNHPRDLLVLDEGAARRILEITRDNETTVSHGE
jgi:central glycolytic genes regulator